MISIFRIAKIDNIGKGAAFQIKLSQKPVNRILLFIEGTRMPKLEHMSSTPILLIQAGQAFQFDLKSRISASGRLYWNDIGPELDGLGHSITRFPVTLVLEYYDQYGNLYVQESEFTASPQRDNTFFLGEIVPVRHNVALGAHRIIKFKGKKSKLFALALAIQRRTKQLRSRFYERLQHRTVHKP